MVNCCLPADHIAIHRDHLARAHDYRVADIYPLERDFLFDPVELYVGGTARLLAEPRLSDVSSLRDLLSLLEERLVLL